MLHRLIPMLVDFVCHTSHVISLTEVIFQKFSYFAFDFSTFFPVGTWQREDICSHLQSFCGEIEK